MLEFALLVLLFAVAVPTVWLTVFRRAINCGASTLTAHVRGVVFSALTFVALAVVLAVALGGLSSPHRADDQASSTHTTDMAEADTSDAAYARATRMYQDRRLEDLENALIEGRVSALKVIPALGGKSNVAKVLTSRGILIGRNAYVSCEPVVKPVNAPGCMLTVYLTHRKPSQQTDLSGVPAHWFMGVNDTRFRPLEGWAQHVDHNDQWLDASGMLGYSDNR